MPFDINGQILTNFQIKNYNEVNIVRGDLVLYLDAGNSSSYPGTGTTWTDLSGNGNHFTLYNGTGYSIGGGGSLTFDGVNDYAASTSNINLTSYTHVAVEVFYRSNTTSAGMVFEHTANWNTNTGGFGMSVNTNGNAGSTNQNHTNHNTEVARNYLVSDNSTWNHNLNLYSRIADSTGRLTYINGLLTSFVSGGFYPTDTITTAGGSFANAIFYISSRGGSSSFFNGSVGSIRVYGFKINAAQTLQNFNASRRRFNI
jgi:hypothetical protein